MRMMRIGLPLSALGGTPIDDGAAKQTSAQPASQNVASQPQAIAAKANVAITPSTIVTLSGQKVAEQHTYAEPKATASPNSAPSQVFGCVGGGAYGIVAGVCNDGSGNKIAYAGVGTPGAGGMAGTVVNGTAADHLAGFSGTAIAPNGTGIGYAPGTPGTVSTVVGTPGASVTYGVPLGSSSESGKPYEFSTEPKVTTNPNECTKSEYEGPFGIGSGNVFGSDAGSTIEPGGGFSEGGGGGGGGGKWHVELDELMA
ncbi:Uncharacterized protein ChrSV_4159 [Chromobacterium vaccinii]|nr:Uncharacterized protein ChrSW_4159 [Chromobacterium vaccinii]QND91616.1 Uncharacterized protein ChrSV_4159 [Chromobacterium vaccinii]